MRHASSGRGIGTSPSSTIFPGRAPTRISHWLRDGTTFDFEHVDVRDRAAIDRVMANGRFDAIIHLAAQVAVTTSVTDPSTDFAVNAFGTFNMLDAVRLHCPEAVFIFASTNKVYGKIAGASSELRGNRYAYLDRPHGIGESEPLDFLSPYGCSKGAADQYTLDYRKNVQDPRDVVPAVVHLRAAPVRRGGSGLGRLVRHRVPARPRHHDLRRRQAGAGRPARRRPPACLRGGHSRAGKDSSGSLQCGRRTRPGSVPYRSDRHARTPAGPQDSRSNGTIGGLATSRSTSATSASSTGCWAGSPKSVSKPASRNS